MRQFLLILLVAPSVLVAQTLPNPQAMGPATEPPPNPSMSIPDFGPSDSSLEAWLECANSAEAKLISAPSVSATEAATAAVDGCFKESFKYREDLKSFFRDDSNSAKAADESFEERRTDMIRFFAAHVVKERARLGLSSR